MFKKFDIEINGKPIRQSQQTYAYKAYIKQLLPITDVAKKGHLSVLLYIEDNPIDKNASVPARSKLITPDIVEKSSTGKTVD